MKQTLKPNTVFLHP